MSELAVTDAHALIWAATGKLRKLGRDARRFYERVDAGRAALYIPTMALVEIGEAHRAGAIAFGGGSSFGSWVEQLLGSGRFIATDLTWGIVSRAQQLFTIPERGDRLIAATAAELDLPLITRDPEIAKAAEVELLW